MHVIQATDAKHYGSMPYLRHIQLPNFWGIVCFMDMQSLLPTARSGWIDCGWEIILKAGIPLTGSWLGFLIYPLGQRGFISVKSSYFVRVFIPNFTKLQLGKSGLKCRVVSHEGSQTDRQTDRHLQRERPPLDAVKSGLCREVVTLIQVVIAHTIAVDRFYCTWFLMKPMQNVKMSVIAHLSRNLKMIYITIMII